jgi:FkbM family methyltransferase
MNCIDIGAHLGSVLSIIKELSPRGKHIAIEPVPYKYQWLKQKYPDVEVLQVAVSDTVGEVDFYLQSQRSGFSGLRLHNSGLTAHNIQPVNIYDFFDTRSYSIFLIKDWPSGSESLVYEQFLKSMQYPFQAFNFLAIPKGKATNSKKNYSS